MDMKIVKSIRIGNCVIAAIGVFTGAAIGFGEIIMGPLIFAAMFASFLITAAGNLINDFFDYEVDAKKGKAIIEEKQRKPMFNLSLLLFSAGILISAFINTHAIAIAGIVSFLLIVYSSLFQGKKYIGNWIVAFGTAMTLIYGASISQNYEIIIFLATSAFFANASREIIKDTEDQEADKGIKKTLPMLINKRQILILIIFFYSIAFLIALVPWITNLIKGAYYLPILFIAGAMFFLSSKLFKANKYSKAQKFSKYGMLLSLIAFLGGIF